MLPKFAAVRNLDGFDESVSPHWLMIGAGNDKSVMLQGGNNCLVTSRNPAVAEIVGDALESASLQQRIITIRGRKKGTTLIDVSEGGNVKTRLEVCVKERREIRVSFHFVVDKNGVGTRRVVGELAGWLDVINNQIFLPQANVFIRQGIVNHPLKINRSLGSVVRDTSSFPQIPKREHEVDLILSQGDKSADINVFFVNNIETAKDPKKNLIAGIQYENGIFIDDVFKHPLATTVNVLAHEFAHFLGVGGESHFYKQRNIAGLMYFRARGGMLIPKVHANVINR